MIARMAWASLAVLLIPSIARGDAPEIEALIKQGVELRRAGKDADALKVFQSAWAKGHTARARAQLGFAQQALGMWIEAEASLADAIEAKDPWIEKNRVALATALGDVRKHLGSLELNGEPKGARINVNGEPSGTLPLAAPLRVVAGSVAVEVSLDGYLTVLRTVAVPAGGLAREAVKLVPSASPAPPIAEAPSAPPPAAVPEPAAPREAPAAPSTSPTAAQTTAATNIERGRFETWKWVTLGVGAAGIATGVIGLAIREGHASRWNSAECLPDNGKTREANCGDEQSAAKSAQTIATVGFIAGGASLAASAVFWFLLGGDSDPVATVQLGQGELGLSLAGRF